jgi:hypothetical protein
MRRIEEAKKRETTASPNSSPEPPPPQRGLEPTFLRLLVDRHVAGTQTPEQALEKWAELLNLSFDDVTDAGMLQI